MKAEINTVVIFTVHIYL